MNKIIKIVAGIIAIPALAIMFAECNDLNLTWLRFLSAAYIIGLALVASRGEAADAR